jgi:hypothetical protein
MSSKTTKPKESPDGRTIVVSIPVSFQQSGGRKQIVVPAGAAEWQPRAPKIDNSLVAAIARAHRWRQMIETQRYASAAELSRKEKVNESYVCRLLRLTLLAPDIVQAILDGRQPSTLELKDLIQSHPPNWIEQRNLLGFA